MMQCHAKRQQSYRRITGYLHKQSVLTMAFLIGFAVHMHLLRKLTGDASKSAEQMFVPLCSELLSSVQDLLLCKISAE